MATRKKLNVCCTLLACLLFASCKGQTKPGVPEKNPDTTVGQPWLIRSQGSGKADNVHCSLQDKKGNLWFATTGDGLYRYDGRVFTNFTMANGLNSNGVFALFEDKGGHIWLGTDKGLSRYDGVTFTHILITMVNTNYTNHFTNKRSDNLFVNSIIEDRKTGNLWIGAENGVYIYDGKTFTRLIDIPNIINPNKFDPQLVLYMIQDKNGHIWFTTRAEGIYRFDGTTLYNYKPNNEGWFRGLLEDKNGHIWIGKRYRGVCRYNGKTFTNVLQGGMFDSCTVSSMIQDKSGNIWFATEAGDEAKRESEGGVWRFDGNEFLNISKRDDLDNDGTWCILEDKFNHFWIGTRNTGLYRYDGKTFTNFSKANHKNGL
jgi:ligand-binding sensor domain-containing protein